MGGVFMNVFLPVLCLGQKIQAQDGKCFSKSPPIPLHPHGNSGIEKSEAQRDSNVFPVLLITVSAAFLLHNFYLTLESLDPSNSCSDQDLAFASSRLAVHPRCVFY